MKTILFEIDQAEFDAIQHREKNHVIIKGNYEVGQRLILQGPEDEISLNVSHAQVAPGLMKGHCILSFGNRPPEGEKMKVHFDEDSFFKCVTDDMDIKHDACELPDNYLNTYDTDQTIHLPHDPIGDEPIN